LVDFYVPTDEERLADYFWKLEELIPNPGNNWAKAAKPCKWERIIKERQKQDPNATG
jgi:hypothetical protein